MKLVALAAVLSALVCVGWTNPSRTIYVRNTSALADAKVQKLLPAIQKALDGDFAPAWHEHARLVFIGSADAPRGAWRIVVMDYPNCLGCLGFHEDNGAVRAEVAASPKADDLSSTISHELWEMLADPHVSAWGDGAKLLYANGCGYMLEVADPVVRDRDAYRIDGVLISDFVLPAWYRPGAAGPYDVTGAVHAPLELVPGGYIYAVCGTLEDQGTP